MYKKMSMIALAFLGMIMVGCGNKEPVQSKTPAGNEVLKVATEGAYAPFSYTLPDGSLAGFDVDVANALCDKIQVTCDIGAQEWEGIIPALKIGKFDAIVAAMSVTPERSEQVDFTEPYFTNSLVFVAKEESTFNPANQQDIDNASIAAQRSTISSQWLQQTYPNARVNLYDTLDNAFLDLGAGRSTAMIADKATAGVWLGSEAGAGFALKGDEIDINDTFAIAVDKGNDTLKERINQALAEIRQDGTYDALVVKHFGSTQ